jgi:hypothetical protein
MISDCVALDCESEEKKGLPEGLPGWLGDIGLRGSPDCESEEKAKGAKGLPGWQAELES